MVETFLFAGVAFLVITVAAVVFFCWVALKVLRGFVRLLVGPVAPRPAYRQIVMTPPPQQQLAPMRMVCCGHIRCRAANPAEAQFCRRCGKALRPAAAVVGQARPSRGRGQLVA